MATTYKEIKYDNQDCYVAIAGQVNSKTVNLTINWNGTGPYTQEVSVSGVTDAWVPGTPVLKTSGNATTDKSNLQEFYKINQITSEANKLIFTAFEEKPGAALTLLVPGLH